MNTPETDKRVWSDHSEGILHEVVEASFARRLERERDKAREDATNYYSKIGELEQELNNMQDQRDLAMKVIARIERERDEAREALEAVNALEEMHAKPGSMEIAIKQNPAQAQWVAKCFASMVAASPNYTEMKFDLVAEGEKWEWLTVLIQKGNGKTPHQLRQEAEKERDQAIADRDIARLSAQDSDRAHDRMVGELEKVYQDRDEAREALSQITEYGTEEINAAIELRQKLASALLERDEARERAAKWESSFDAMERAGAEQARRADENREWALMAERERDEARELCRELIDLVAYGLGQSGQEWSLDAMRQAMEKIQKAKSLEAK